MVIKINIEIVFLFLLLIITACITNIYNNKKLVTNKNYKELINNIYFQKSLIKIFDDLTPRFKSINHKISSGETFDKILNNYSIPGNEILDIKYFDCKMLSLLNFELMNFLKDSILSFLIENPAAKLCPPPF